MSVPTTRAFRWLALVLLALGIGVMALGSAEQPASPTGMLPDGAESTRVAELQAQQPGDEGGTAIVLFSSDDPLDLAVLGQRAGSLGGPLIPNEDGTGALVPVDVSSNGLSDNAERVQELRDQASSDLPEGVTAQVTGPAAIDADLSGVFEGANFLLLGVTALIVAVLLIVTYRSPILWIIPLLVIGVADRVAATAFTWVLDAFGVVWNESTTGILSVLVFGAGTNYALLLISRYRDELHRHENRFEAMATAWGPTARTVLASAVTVVIGVACLLLSATPSTRGLGLASAVGIAIAFIFGVFVLPGVLLFFGRWIFWPVRPKVGEEPDHRVWDRISGFVRRRPVPLMIVSLVVLGISCLGALQVSTGISQSEQFIDTPESIAASEELSEKFPGQDATPAIVVTTQPEEATAILEGEGATVQEDEPVGEQAFLQVSGPDTAELRELLAETDALVGGQDAQLYDTEEYAGQDRILIFPLVLALVFVALIFLLRSLLAPAIMVASVLLTNVAALGLGWWISSGLFGFDNFDSTTPLYAFVFLVALGIDYTIFLVTRAREEAGVHGTKEGILRSLSATGGVITSAGILLAAVFAALGVLPLVVLAQVGIVIFIGVLLDTLIVRTILVPSLVQLLGEKFWWPAKVDSKRPRDNGDPCVPAGAGSTAATAADREH
ncbi:MMPL family transporter [Corynebacterium halotolerans]|uniref:MmpL domain-containing protein n=1 Tax=Corynebacterium halotolerans YIM 70093 = DSM 44683 TaxID=1121362 RepID=M1NMY2_9CORY|nr:MMPL family transporter [Corynebacterium halotolerans]AGF72733.1 MmpL domain-containing protein [Corynebacterium halotolerans YIM 70093 = DSM 44683]